MRYITLCPFYNRGIFRLNMFIICLIEQGLNLKVSDHKEYNLIPMPSPKQASKPNTASLVSIILALWLFRRIPCRGKGQEDFRKPLKGNEIMNYRISG